MDSEERRTTKHSEITRVASQRASRPNVECRTLISCSQLELPILILQKHKEPFPLLIQKERNWCKMILLLLFQQKVSVSSEFSVEPEARHAQGSTTNGTSAAYRQIRDV